MFKREDQKTQEQLKQEAVERSKSKSNQSSFLQSLVKQELPSKVKISKIKIDSQDLNSPLIANQPMKSPHKTPLKSILKKTPSKVSLYNNNDYPASTIFVKDEPVDIPMMTQVKTIQMKQEEEQHDSRKSTLPSSSIVQETTMPALPVIKSEEQQDVVTPIKLGKRGNSERQAGKKVKKSTRSSSQFIDNEADECNDEAQAVVTQQVIKQQFYQADELKKETADLNSVIQRIEARAKATAAQRNSSGYRADSDGQFKREFDEDNDDVEMSNSASLTSAQLLQKYANENLNAAEVERDVTLPSNQDSKLWRLKVKPGMERQLVFRLTNKLFTKLNEGQPLLVMQVFECENTPGIIYVEAHKLSHVEQLMRGISGIYQGKNSTKMIPIGEMTDIMRQCCQMKESPLQKMQWVRVKKGVYEGDLGLVQQVLEKNKVLVRLIPRIPEIWLDGNQDKKVEFFPKTYKQLEANLKNQPHVRVPKKKFNPKFLVNQNSTTDEIEQCFREFYRPLKKSFKVWRDLKFRNGMIYLPLKINKLSYEDNVCPSLEEVKQFQGHAFLSQKANTSVAAALPDDYESDLDEWDLLPDKYLVKTICQDKALKVQVGDHCRVINGQFQGCQGEIKLIQEEDGLATLMTNDKISVPIKVAATSLEKVFSIGQGVRVLQGVYAGELGLVVDITQDQQNDGTTRKATVLMEAIKTELRIPISNLRRREQFDPKHGLLADYFKSPHCNKLDLTNKQTKTQTECYTAGDLVLIEGHQKCGLVLQVQPDSLKVLYNTNKTGLVKLSEVSKKINVETRGVNNRFLKRAAVCTDKYHNVITIRSLVKPTERNTLFYQCVGEVRAIYKDQLFLHIQRSPNLFQVRHSNGFYAIKSFQVCNVGHECIQDAHQKSKFAPVQQLAGIIAGRADRRERDHEVKGKTIYIGRGPLKGYKGKIVCADEITATIQIFAKGNQQVTLQRDAIILVEDEAAMTRTARQGDVGPMQISFDEAMGQQFVNAQCDAEGNPIQEQEEGRLTPVGGFDADLDNVDAMWLDQGN